MMGNEDARILQAVLGTCPDCGHATCVDNECLIDEPVMTPTGIDRRKRIGAAVLCGGCEFAAEIPAEMVRALKARVMR